MLRKGTLYFACSVVISAVLIWWLLGRQDWHELLANARAVSLPFLGGYLALALTGAFIRAVRYNMLIASKKVRIGGLVLVTLVRNLFVDLLPARAGELAYIVVLTRRFGFPFETGASTFATAFVLDFAALGALVTVVALATGFGKNPLADWRVLAFSAGMFAVAMLIVLNLVRFVAWVVRSLELLLAKLRLTRRTPAKFLLGKLAGVVESLRSIRERRITGRLFLVSVAVRLCKYVSLYLLVLAFLSGSGRGEADFGRVFLTTTATEIVTVTPVHGVGGLGTWPAAWGYVASQLLGMERRHAERVAILAHGTTQVVEYTLGIFALLALGVPIVMTRRRGCAGSAAS